MSDSAMHAVPAGYSATCVCPTAGDTDSSSDFEAIPTIGGLKFRDTPSPSGSEFNTPPASLVGRAASITSDEEDAFGTPRAAVAGPSGSGPQGRNPVQLHGPVFQVSPAPSLFLFFVLYHVWQ